MPPSVDFSIAIEGMHCGGCVNRVTAALQKVDGVEVRRVEVGSALVTLDPDKATADQVLAAVARIGFPARAAG
jgi:copper chaperone CopZ